MLILSESLCARTWRQADREGHRIFPRIGFVDYDLFFSCEGQSLALLKPLMDRLHGKCLSFKVEAKQRAVLLSASGSGTRHPNQGQSTTVTRGTLEVKRVK